MKLLQAGSFPAPAGVEAIYLIATKSALEIGNNCRQSCAKQISAKLTAPKLYLKFSLQWCYHIAKDKELLLALNITGERYSVT